MKLSPRLYCVAKQIQQGAIVADIGTDHAYIPVYLVENNISNLVYACDIGEGPLEIAKEQINKANLRDNIIPLLGEGLKPVDKCNVDNIVIAGMGGILIQNIIDQHKSLALSVNRLILQPMIAQEELRRYLLNSGFKIIQEDLAMESRRIYQIIVAQSGEMSFDKDIYYQIGYDLIHKKHPLLGDLVAFYRNKYEQIIRQCKNEKTYNALDKVGFCEKKLKELKEIEDVI